MSRKDRHDCIIILVCPIDSNLIASGGRTIECRPVPEFYETAEQARGFNFLIWDDFDADNMSSAVDIERFGH